MNIVYLASAVADLVWMRDYYQRVLPEGAHRAREQVRKAELVLRAHPDSGRPTGMASARELVIPRTPFSFVYRVSEGRIEILRIWDNRANRSSLDLI